MPELGDNLVLGKLCKRRHEHENTGKSLRYRSNRNCCQCHLEHRRSSEQAAKHRIRKYHQKSNGEFPVTLTYGWILENTPEKCPVLGITLMRGCESRDNSPSVDRLIPELGYVPENCRVISNRANQIKSNASPAELRKVAAWLEQELKLASSQERVLQ
jgi:hypothetical protein